MADDSPLRGDDDSRTVASPCSEGGGDESLVVPDVALVQAIRIGSVDQGDAGIEDGGEHAEGLRFGRTPVEGEMHATVTDGRDGRRSGTERTEDQTGTSVTPSRVAGSAAASPPPTRRRP